MAPVSNIARPLLEALSFPLYEGKIGDLKGEEFRRATYVVRANLLSGDRVVRNHFDDFEEAIESIIVRVGLR